LQGAVGERFNEGFDEGLERQAKALRGLLEGG
jgi:hypothetical protein